MSKINKISILLLVCTACNNNEDLLVLKNSGASFGQTVQSSAVLNGQIVDNVLSGTISYQENYAQEEAHCSTDLRVIDSSTSALCAEQDPTNDWCYQFTVETTEDISECLFLSPITSFNLAEPSVYGFLSYTAEGVDEDGSAFAHQLVHGYIAEENPDLEYQTIFEANTITDWDGDVRDFELEQSLANAVIPAFFEECLEEVDTDSEEMFTFKNTSQSTLACDDFENIADVWTLDLTEGQTLKASADTAQDGVHLNMYLTGPDGCLIDHVYANAECSNPSEACPSLEYSVPTTGTHTIVISSDWCAGNDEYTYTIGAKVE